MKRVLFVGDGKHDIGRPEWPTDAPFPARGVVPHLAARAAAIDRQSSIAMHWAHPRLARFQPATRFVRTRGYDAKIRAAALQIERGVLAVDGLVCVVDEDNEPARRGLPSATRDFATSDCPIVCGVAVRSIEAWTLGARSALAGALGTTPQALQRAYPTIPVEELYEGSGKEKHRSKRLLRALANLANREDDLGLREEVAERTDPAELCATCPIGFAPFAAGLRAAFGSVDL